MTEIAELRAELAELRERIEQRATEDQRSRLSARAVGAAGPSWELGASWMTEVERQLSRIAEQLSRLQLDLNTQFSLIHERFQQANGRFDRIETDLHSIRTGQKAILSAVERLAGPGEAGTPGPR